MANRGANKVILVGNLGADPDIRYLLTGGMVTALRLATGEIWKDQEGKQQERTEWHRVVFYRRLAKVAAEFLKKGSKLDIFKKPVHVVPMWSAALGRSVEIQTTASRTGLWAGMDRPVWGPDVTQSFTGRFKDDNDIWQENTVTVTFPEWVAVTVYRLVGGRRRAFTEEVYWLEAYSTAGGKNSQLPAAMWIKRPKGQL